MHTRDRGLTEGRSMKSWYETIKFTVQTSEDSIKQRSYTGEVIIKFSRRVCNEDGDGNRGSLRIFLDDWKIQELVFEGRDINISSLPKKEQEKIDREINRYIDNYEYEIR